MKEATRTTMRTLCTFAFLLILICGCGPDTPSSIVEARMSAQTAYDEGIKAFEQKDYSLAEEKLTKALSIGNLYSELIDDARAKRIVSLAAQDKLDEAVKALQELKEDAVQQELVYLAHSYVLKKQGALRKSKQAFAKARKLNLYAKKFE